MYNAFISYSHSADTELAARLQTALEKFAKPWYKIRNLNIFRDESNLEATPHLWENIRKAMDKSDYFVLLASPESAKSSWVEKEINHWLESHSIDKIIIVLTDGEVSWETRDNNDRQSTSNALPEILEEKLSDAPFYVDLRESKKLDELDLKFPLFRRHILKLASQLHGIAPKDLAGEELRQHRKVIRLRNAAISMLTILFVAATVAAIMAYFKQKEAQENYQLAEERRKVAQANFLIAEAQLEHNPTKAVELAIQAYWTNKDKIILNRAYQIFSDQHVYQRLKVPDTFDYPVAVQFLPESNKFVTHHKQGDRLFQNLKEGDPGTDLNPDDDPELEERFVVRSINGSIEAVHGKEYLDTFLANKESYNSPVSYDVGYDEEKFNLYDKETNRLVRKYPYAVSGASYKEGFVTPDNKKIISVWNDGAIRVLDIGTGYMSTYETGGLPRLEFGMVVGTDDYATYDTLVTISSDGAHMIVAANNELQYWNLANRGIIGSYLSDTPVQCARFSEDGSTLKFKTDSGTFDWNIDLDQVGPVSESFSCVNETELRTQPRFQLGGERNDLLMERVADSFRTVLKTPQTISQFIELSKPERLLTISEDSMRIYPVPTLIDGNDALLTEQQMIPNRDPKDEIRNIVFSPDESKFLLSMIDYDDFQLTYELWDVTTGASICTFPSIFAMEAGSNPIITFSSDGSRLLITYDRMITIWDNPITLEELPYFREASLTAEEEP